MLSPERNRPEEAAERGVQGGEPDVRIPTPPPAPSLSLVAPCRLLLSQPASFACPHPHAGVPISLVPLGSLAQAPPQENLGRAQALLLMSINSGMRSGL